MVKLRNSEVHTVRMCFLREHYQKEWLLRRSRRQRDPDEGLRWG